MGWNFFKWDQKNISRIEQALPAFKEYYLALNSEHRQHFREWINQVSKPYSDSEDDNGWLCGQLGWADDRSIECTIKVRLGDQKAEIEPQILRQAVEAWDRSEDFCHVEKR